VQPIAARCQNPKTRSFLSGIRFFPAAASDGQATRVLSHVPDARSAPLLRGRHRDRKLCEPAVYEGLATPSRDCSMSITPVTNIESAAISVSPNVLSPGRRSMVSRFECADAIHWEFRGHKIVRKDSYWKIVDAPA
jgi:hypothetical protein